jgi:hypothetical protein
LRGPSGSAPESPRLRPIRLRPAPLACGSPYQCDSGFPRKSSNAKTGNRLKSGEFEARGRNVERCRHSEMISFAVMGQAQMLPMPPDFCQYTAETCDKDFSKIDLVDGLFLFPSEPKPFAATIEAAKDELQGLGGSWRSWTDFDVAGQLIFCEICKGIRGASRVFADVTTLNFNLLFEVGFCIGLGVPVKPIRDSSVVADSKLFEGIRVLETLGYIDFANAHDLAEKAKRAEAPQLGNLPKRIFTDAPVYVLKGPLQTEGAGQLLSALKKSLVKRFRVHDPSETPRTSLYEQWKQVRGSFGIIANLLSPKRGEVATVHNALCAFLCGIAMAEEKAVLMLQEETGNRQPIDYGDVVREWDDPRQIQELIGPTVLQVFERMQAGTGSGASTASGVLELLDLGDVAAENEIAGLERYFVRTGPFGRARQGHGRLVVGRKGSGKTAMFYGVRKAVSRGHATLMLDFRPEGFQFTKLREAVLEALSEGQKEQAVTALWTFLLTAEIAHKILFSEGELLAAERDGRRFERYEALQQAFLSHGLASDEDLSQRFLRQIDKLAERVSEAGEITARTNLIELVYGGDLRTLSDAVAEYVAEEKEQIWLLIDNLDKSWATRGATFEDILVVQGLLEASRKLERSLGSRDIDFHCLVFIRPDVLELLNRYASDRGKETPIELEWDDRQLFRDILQKRIEDSTEITGGFDEAWAAIAEPAVGIRDSFDYIVDRTLMRPRDALLFVQRAQQVALNRSHPRITQDDIEHAEIGYSEEALVQLGFEMEDTHPGMVDALFAFHGAPTRLSRDQVENLLQQGKVSSDETKDAIELLLWFGFLGVQVGGGEPMYSHTVHFTLRRLTHPMETSMGQFIIHPAFRQALEIRG